MASKTPKMAQVPEGESDYYPLDKLVNWQGNFNQGDAGSIFGAIKKFGYNRSISIWQSPESETSAFIVMAGNHTLMALKMLYKDWITAKQRGNDNLDKLLPKGNIIVRDDMWYIICNNCSHLTYDLAVAYAIADNRMSEIATKDNDMLLKYLMEIGESDDPELMDAVGYDDDDIQFLLDAIGKDDDDEDGENGGLGGGGKNSPPLSQVERESLVNRFVVPPFTILDSKQGYWVERKNLWLRLGIDSELGRDDDDLRQGLTYHQLQPTGFYDLKNKMRDELGHEPDWDEVMAESQRVGVTTMTLTSVFDPVLCEITYRWFSNAGSRVLDPFAGGSVRGIVAGFLGREYTGIDLSERQIEANTSQAAAIFEGVTETVEINVSAKMARLKFNGCDPDYIRDICHASCCQSSASPTGTMITIHPSEISVMEGRGASVIDGLLQPSAGEKQCPFKTDDHLCGLHFTPDKPFGCIASPFTLNKNNTLIVRNRYKMLKCYNDGAKIPAYVAFRASLNLLFGEDEAQRICTHFEDGGGDIVAKMPYAAYKMLVENDDIKHGRVDKGDAITPRWLVGDSMHIESLAEGEFDLIFSCPPYADLEVYSDKPADLSNMDYDDFVLMYGEIINRACTMLKDNRFACFVVGEVRDKKSGVYRNFVGHTIQAFLDAGLDYYNEGIFVTPFGSAPIRATRQFNAGKKLLKVHQQYLVFVKGDPKLATEYCGFAYPVDEEAEDAGLGAASD